MASSSSKLVSRLSSGLRPLASRLNGSNSYSSIHSPLLRHTFPSSHPRFPLPGSPVDLSRVGSIRPYSAMGSVKTVARAFAPDTFKEIIMDYVHNEMTRTWVLIGWRLFLIIAAKDAVVYLIF